MVPPELDLEELLRQLAAQRGITRKLRLAARYWRQLEQLSPGERERVALALGSQAAWRRLERLFSRDGRLSDDELAVQAALDRLGHADPAELRRWARVLRGGDRRKVGDLVATAVREALEQEAEEAGPGSETAVTSAAAQTELAGDPAETPAAGDLAETPAPSGPTETPAANGLAETPAAGGPAGTSVAHRPAETVVAPPAGPASAAAEPAGDEPGPRPRETPPRSRRSPDRPADGGREGSSRGAPAPAVMVRRPPRTVEPPAGGRSVFEAAGWLPSAGRESAGHPVEPGRLRRPAVSAVERLRELQELHRNPMGVAALGAAGRAALVARLGPGWASRRAVSAMIRGGCLASVDEALQLIAGLDSPARRSWCLGVLVDESDLTEAERERVLEAAPSAAARRRLALRCG